MEKMIVEEILEVVRGRLLGGVRQSPVLGISTDSRTLRGGELFLALKGEKYDGHDFVEEALEKGAGGVIISSNKFAEHLYTLKGTGGHKQARPLRMIDGPFTLPGASKSSSGNSKKGNFYSPELPVRSCRPGVVIQVTDTLKALQDLAGYYRKKFNIPFIVVTGTNGKTTTKDMAAAILGRKLNVLKAEGSFNNQIGVPLTLLRLSASHQTAVLEVGMSGCGEIAPLARLIKPQVGVLTNIGSAHLEFFKDPEEMAEAEAELIGVLGEEETFILNRDDPRVWAHQPRVKGRVISFGIEEKADFQAHRIEELADGRTRFALSVSGGREERIEIELPIPGYANIYNALAATAISVVLTRDLTLIKKGLESFQPSSGRMEVISLNLRGSSSKIRVINDSYNANPESMKMALRLLNHLRVRGRKVAVLGDMLELGEWGEEAHREVGKPVASCSPDILITVGRLSRFLAEEAKQRGLKGEVFKLGNSREAGERLVKIVRENDTILVKGSRGMQMEEVVNVLSSLS